MRFAGSLAQKAKKRLREIASKAITRCSPDLTITVFGLYAPIPGSGSSSTLHLFVWPGRDPRTVGRVSKSMVWVCGSADPGIDSCRNATIATHMAWRSIGRMNHRVWDYRTLCAIVVGATLAVHGVSACRANRQRASTSYHPGYREFRYQQFLIYILSNS